MLLQWLLVPRRPQRASRARTRRSQRRSATLFSSLQFEPLETRAMFTATPAPILSPIQLHPTLMEISPQGSASPVGRGFTPSQIRHAYGLDQVMFGSVAGDGTGQTIAIIDAYHSPTIVNDLKMFDQQFGLPAPPSFRVVAQDGTLNYPRTDPAGAGHTNWEMETALDVEWAHAMAPKANLLLVEANGPTLQDLMQTAVDYARSQPGVVAISMSFGSGEFSSETSLDRYFTTPTGHNGVTFVASSGDSGRPGLYPSASTNVVSIGGTRLSLDASGNYSTESGWSGSGGGVSPYEPLPSFQTNVMSGLWRRGTPDVSFDADPASGVAVYDSYNGGASGPWYQIGGTSFSAPAWAGIVAVVDQGRSLAGRGSLDGATQTLPMLYALPSTDFHDVIAGSNGYSAGAGYDLVTGRGSPIANLLIADLVSGAFDGAQGGGGGGGGNGGGGTVPVNDTFASPVSLSGTTASALGTNVNATQQAGEPSVANVSGGHSVWWTWTAPASGTTVISTAGSNYDTTLGVFTGSAVNALTNVVANDDESVFLGVMTSRVSFNAVAGTTYRIAVDGYHGAAGNIALGLTETVPAPAPPPTTPPPTTNAPANDNFAQRTVLSGATTSATGANIGATRQTGEPLIVNNSGGHSVWWSWTAPSTGNVVMTTAGSDFDTLLGVYTGTTVGGLRLVASNDDQSWFTGIVTSRVSFRAVAGTTYQIAVDGFRGATGHIAFAISPATTAAAASSPSAPNSGRPNVAVSISQLPPLSHNSASYAAYIAAVDRLLANSLAWLPTR